MNEIQVEHCMFNDDLGKLQQYWIAFRDDTSPTGCGDSPVSAKEDLLKNESLCG